MGGSGDTLYDEEAGGPEVNKFEQVQVVFTWVPPL